MWRGSTISLVLASALAHAQVTSSARAHELFDAGRALLAQGDIAGACDRFAESIVIERTIGTELNLGDCHEQLGHLAEAWRFFDAAAAELEGTNDGRAAFARQRADALVSRLATVIVKLSDPATAGLHVTIGDRPVTAAPEIRERFDPGEIVVRASVPQHKAFEQRATAAAGATVVVEVPAFESEVPAGSGPRDRGRVRLAYAVGGGGGALAIGGLVVALVARSRYQGELDNGNCANQGGVVVCNATGFDRQQSAITLANVGTGLAVVGTAAVAVAAVVYLTAPRTPIVPIATGNAVGFAVCGAF